MPFTFAHPAAVLPFRNWSFLSASVLIIGSMAPDLAYFYQMQLDGRYSHTIEGIFLLDIPIALGTYMLFHFLVKQCLIPNLPLILRKKLGTLLDFDALAYVKRNPIGLVLSILTGIFSHILWDSFTHSHKDLGFTWASFSQEMIYFKEQEIPLYELLQHISTLVGLALIIFVFKRMPTSLSRAERESNKWYWVIVLLITALIFIFRASYGIRSLGNLVVVSIASLMYGLVLGSLIWRLFFQPGLRNSSKPSI